MGRLLKRTGYTFTGLIGVLLLLGAYLYIASDMRLNETYAVQPEPIPIPADSAAVARGRHIAVTRGCSDCHGENLSGAAFADNFVMGRIVGSNLTSGTGGIGKVYSDIDWVRAIRHGIGPDGQPLILMPSYEYYHLSDEDLGALIAYLKQLPPVDHQVPGSSPGPMARFMVLTGELKLAAEVINHDAPRPEAPPPGPTVEYGAYLAKGCTGCHGNDFSGGPIPATPPSWPKAANITPHPEGIGNWTKVDFVRALRKKRRPDGSEIDPVMPAEMGQFTDEEMTALWKYLRTVEPQPTS